MEPPENDKELRTLNDEELLQILENHQKWLQLSDYGKIHHKLGLAHKNFKADLSYCNFKSSDKLRDVELIQADLTGTDFQDAKLHRTAFKSANLAGVNFSGSDLTGALFTEDPFESRLATIEEASRISRKLFAWLLGLMGFFLLTIFSTQDYQLILNKTTSPLPIIQTPMPLAWFYWIAPIILIVLYWYFHLHQLHIWRLISHLPAYFPDGTPLDQKIFPWMIVTWSKKFFNLLKKEGKNSGKNQYRLVVFLIWVSIPMVLFGFWIRYLPRHDMGSILHILVLVLSILIGRYFYYRAKQILKRDSVKSWNWKKYFATHGWYMEIPILVFTCFFTWVAIKGDLNWWPQNMRPLITANLINQELSEKPSNWDSDLEGIDPNLDEKTKNDLIKKHKKQLSRVEEVKWRRINLRYARARNAFLAKAHLEEANLQGMSLFGANLEEAYLSGANLQEASPIRANLQEAFLYRANLQKANLYGANLQEANLERANLQQVHLRKTNLEKAELSGANLQEANLTSANLQEANLERANLQKADLRGANLQEAILFLANLQYAILINAKGLDVNQIQKAQNWERALYDNPLRKKLGISDDRLRKTITGALKDPYPPMSESEKAVQKNKWNCLYELPDCQKSTSSNIKPSPVPQP